MRAGICFCFVFVLFCVFFVCFVFFLFFIDKTWKSTQISDSQNVIQGLLGFLGPFRVCEVNTVFLTVGQN